ncbi:DUF1294 domain-containing protein [Thioalkalivibrio sp. ALE16]|uniref:DUF1294 domain-containing protein n=1 Tax=Thioalkalivibrio sp. ALE16 TaxID=1158172 RepID=UPI00037847A3|nr:DUF1294 domain-containing protein [Thioalkalivibrio sp. ALE16]
MDASLPLLVGAWLIGANVLSFVLYGLDKQVAADTGRQRRSRIPEKTLLAVDFAGGFPAGFIAQRQFRHKTRKASYQAKWWMAAIASTGAWGWLAIQAI